MFSGIVEEMATVVAVEKQQENVDFTLKCSFVNELVIDQSVAHNGVCLTVVRLTDDTYTVTAMKDAGGSTYYTFRYDFDPEMARRGYFTVDKGSVTVNGVSLTVCDPTPDTFSVAIIPYTHDNTNFHDIAVGSVVNIEFDILGKYIARLSSLTQK